MNKGEGLVFLLFRKILTMIYLYNQIDMKKIFYASVIIAAVSILAVSCTKDEKDDEYYVRYDASCQVKQEYQSMSEDQTKMVVSFTTPAGTQSFSSPECVFSEVAGPFKKGDEVKMEAYGYLTGKMNYVISSIYVSKNNGPFALQAKNGGITFQSCGCDVSLDF